MESVALGLPKIQDFPVDANGIPIKPGYRPPFNSETGRAAAFACARARAKLVEDAKIARQVLRQVHGLLTKPKRGSRPYLQKLGDVGKPSSIPPTITPRAPKKSRSNGKIEGKNVGAKPQQ